MADSNPWSAENDYNPNAAPNEAPVYDPRDPDRKRRGCGCWLYGCLIVALGTLVLLVAGGIAAFYFAKGQLRAFTDDAPAPIPVVEAAPEEIKAIGERVQAFVGAVRAGGEGAELSLTAEDLNTLVAADRQLKGRVHLTITDGRIGAKVAVPCDFLPAGAGKGRFFNAEATLNASLENGVLVVTLVDAKVKGQQLPAPFLDAIKGENLAQGVQDDAEIDRVLKRFESIRVEGDRVVLRLRAEAPAAGEGEQAVEEPPLENDRPAESGAN
ncbi:MAG: hypothetical protein ACRCT8_11010 [Lacipirellulaceae bacterium]